jgi:hypothetical protein
MGPDHHRVFMYTPDLSVSNQKETRQRRVAILSDPNFHFMNASGLFNFSIVLKAAKYKYAKAVK